MIQDVDALIAEERKARRAVPSLTGDWATDAATLVALTRTDRDRGMRSLHALRSMTADERMHFHFLFRARTAAADQSAPVRPDRDTVERPTASVQYETAFRERYFPEAARVKVKGPEIWVEHTRRLRTRRRTLVWPSAGVVSR